MNPCCDGEVCAFAGLIGNTATIAAQVNILIVSLMTDQKPIMHSERRTTCISQPWDGYPSRTVYYPRSGSDGYGKEQSAEYDIDHPDQQSGNRATKDQGRDHGQE